MYTHIGEISQQQQHTHRGFGAVHVMQYIRTYTYIHRYTLNQSVTAVSYTPRWASVLGAVHSDVLRLNDSLHLQNASSACKNDAEWKLCNVYQNCENCLKYIHRDLCKMYLILRCLKYMRLVQNLSHTSYQSLAKDI